MKWLQSNAYEKILYEFAAIDFLFTILLSFTQITTGTLSFVSEETVYMDHKS